MATINSNAQTVEAPRATREDLEEALLQLQDMGIKADKVSKPRSTKPVRKPNLKGGGTPKAVTPSAYVEGSDDEPETEPEAVEFTAEQLETIERLEALREQRRQEFAAVLGRVEPDSGLDWLVNKQVTDNVRHLLGQECYAGLDAGWALKFIERGYQLDGKLMSLLARWASEPTKPADSPKKGTEKTNESKRTRKPRKGERTRKSNKFGQSRGKKKLARKPTPKPATKASEPVGELDYEALEARWKELRNGCGEFLQDVVDGLMRAKKSHAFLLMKGPKDQVERTIEMFGAREHSAFEIIERLLGGLEEAAKDHLQKLQEKAAKEQERIEREQASIAGQLERLEQRRQVFLAEAGLERPRDVAVIHRPALFDTVAEQFEAEMEASAIKSQRDAVNFVREQLNEAIEANQPKDEPQARTERNNGYQPNGEHNVPDTVGVVIPVGSLGKGIKIGAPNQQGRATTRGVAVAGVRGSQTRNNRKAAKGGKK